MTVLAADALSVNAADGTPLVSDVSLRVDAGETILLCGSPGSGKTLLVKALKGLLDDRNDLSVRGMVTRNGRLGFVLQSPGRQLVRRTVRRDVAFGLENQARPPDEIESRIDRYAELLDATRLLDREVKTLSRGETTKVAVLGVLVTEPDVLILDEPLSVLDYPNSKLVLNAIDRLDTTETAVIIAEHDARNLLTRADRVVILRDGRIAADGRPRDVVGNLYNTGVKLPFNTEVSLRLRQTTDGNNEPIPLSLDDSGVEPK